MKVSFFPQFVTLSKYLQKILIKEKVPLEYFQTFAYDSVYADLNSSSQVHTKYEKGS